MLSRNETVVKYLHSVYKNHTILNLELNLFHEESNAAKE